MNSTGNQNIKRPSKHHSKSKTLSRPFLFTAQARSIFGTEPTSQPSRSAAIFTIHPNFCITSMEFLWEAGVIWYTPQSSSRVTIYGGARPMKEHDSDVHHSSAPTSMNSVSSPECWWNRAQIPLQHIQWLYGPKLTSSIYGLNWVS